eukprot:Skav231553  [mRNA]  locus=scaffold481:18554:20431:- [translate_table: standard]
MMLHHPSGTKDYRDLQFLKKLSAAALFGTLMSSSGLAYALALTWPLERCLMLMFQMVGVPLAAHAYLRTYVARAVLDPKRSQLRITGCSWFGAPRSTEEVIFLDHLRPGYSLEGGYIKFRVEGPSWDISRWIWFRMARGAHGTDTVRPGKQVPSSVTLLEQVMPGIFLEQALVLPLKARTAE